MPKIKKEKTIEELHEELLEKIKEAQDTIGDGAVELIREYLNLENFSDNGTVIKASCPFGHSDSSPSFVWNSKEHYFKCFSCGKTYDILKLLTDKHDSFESAVNELFEMAGMDYRHKTNHDHEDFFEGYTYPPEETNTDRALVEAYCEKRGISKNTLDAMGVKQDKHGNVVFELRDINNKFLSVKYRLARAVKKDEPKMWWYTVKDESGTLLRTTCPSLYNMNKIDYTKPLLIVEGYFDAISCYEAGYTNVVSIHGGAEDLKWIEFNYDFLEMFDDIVLWFDNDTAGQDGLNKAINRLGEYRCKYVSPTKEEEDVICEYYKSLGVKNKEIRKTDANNILLACGKNKILSLIKESKEIPSKRLKYLMDFEPVNVFEMERTPTGFSCLDNLIYGNLFPCFTIYSGYAGCVDADTEYFNGKEWKRIADYKAGDKVLEYTEDGKGKLVKPSVYHKYPADYLWHFETKYGLDQCLSEEHNVYYMTSKGNLYHKTFKEVMDNHNSSVMGFIGKFITTFDYSGKGINLTDAEIKLMCAVICDGSFNYNLSSKAKTYSTCRFHIKKERKKDRLREIFKECNLEYREIESAKEGYTDFYIKVPRREKEFTSYWYDCNQHQLQVVCDNILFWDGCESNGRKTFSSNNKPNADFVQFAFSTCGYRANLLTNDRTNQTYITNGKEYIRQSIEYTISISERTLVSMKSHKETKAKIEPYKTIDGFKYCFTVDSHMWIMRRNGKIVITGNCGKSSFANLSCLVSSVENGYKAFVYSGELDNGQLADWIYSPLAGRSHTLEWDNDGGRKGYSIATEALKCIKDYYRKKYILYDDEEGLDTSGETVLSEMEVAYKRFGCRVFLIDNLMTLSFEQVDEDSRWESQKKFIKKLMGFTKKYNVNVNLIVHPKKPAQGITSEHSVYDLHGASEIGNLCHRLIWVDRLVDDEEGYDVKISIIKDRPSQMAGKFCKMKYDFATRRIYGTDEEKNKKYAWEKDYTVTYTKDLQSRLLCNLKEEKICDQF